MSRFSSANRGSSYWGVYQACVHPFYPALVSYDDFGARLFSFLNRRQTERSDDGVRDADPSWLALVFSVLACGVQFSADPIKERDLRSKVFGTRYPLPPNTNLSFRLWVY